MCHPPVRTLYVRRHNIAVALKPTAVSWDWANEP